MFELIDRAVPWIATGCIVVLVGLFCLYVWRTR